MWEALTCDMLFKIFCFVQKCIDKRRKLWKNGRKKMSDFAMKLQCKVLTFLRVLILFYTLYHWIGSFQAPLTKIQYGTNVSTCHISLSYFFHFLYRKQKQISVQYQTRKYGSASMNVTLSQLFSFYFHCEKISISS